eukprot:1160059-Pelagomonas_calceolata.AAC.11
MNGDDFEPVVLPPLAVVCFLTVRLPDLSKSVHFMSSRNASHWSPHLIYAIKMTRHHYVNQMYIYRAETLLNALSSCDILVAFQQGHTGIASDSAFLLFSEF